MGQPSDQGSPAFRFEAFMNECMHDEKLQQIMDDARKPATQQAESPFEQAKDRMIAIVQSMGIQDTALVEETIRALPDKHLENFRTLSDQLNDGSAGT